MKVMVVAEARPDFMKVARVFRDLRVVAGKTSSFALDSTTTRPFPTHSISGSRDSRFEPTTSASPGLSRRPDARVIEGSRSSCF